MRSSPRAGVSSRGASSGWTHRANCGFGRRRDKAPYTKDLDKSSRKISSGALSTEK